MADLVTIFCEINDFCKQFEKQFEGKLLSAKKAVRNRAFRMTISEIITISMYYHFSGYHTFKDHYIKHVLAYLYKDFRLVSYSQFIELRQHIIIPLLVFLVTHKLDHAREYRLSIASALKHVISKENIHIKCSTVLHGKERRVWDGFTVPKCILLSIILSLAR